MVGDGELRSKIENMIKFNDINIQLTGFINQMNLPEIYSISDFIVAGRGMPGSFSICPIFATLSSIPIESFER